MDPDEAYRDLLYALTRGRIDDARILAGDLREWVDKGGFPPEGLGLEETRVIARFVLGLKLPTQHVHTK